MPLKIATFNINGVNGRLPTLLRFDGLIDAKSPRPGRFFVGLPKPFLAEKPAAPRSWGGRQLVSSGSLADTKR